MCRQKINKAYISELDRFLMQFDSEHEKTPSQLAEIEKNRRIAKFRDEIKEPPLSQNPV